MVSERAINATLVGENKELIAQLKANRVRLELMGAELLRKTVQATDLSVALTTALENSIDWAEDLDRHTGTKTRCTELARLFEMSVKEDLDLRTIKAANLEELAGFAQELMNRLAVGAKMTIFDDQGSELEDEAIKKTLSHMKYSLQDLQQVGTKLWNLRAMP